MVKSLSITLLVLSGCVALFVFAAVAALLLVDANAYKPRLEAAASTALGLEVSVDGPLRIRLFPSLLVTVQDLHIRNRGRELAFATEARLNIDLLPLLQRKLRIAEIALKQPSIIIERDRDGLFQFQKQDAADGNVTVVDLERVSFTDGTFRYTDRQSGEGFGASDCRLDVGGLRLSDGGSPNRMKDLSFTAAELACGEIRKNDFTLTDVKLWANAKNGVLDLHSIAMRIFGGKGIGSIQADFSGAVPVYRVLCSLRQFHIEKFLKTVLPNRIAQGTMDFWVNVSLQGETVSAMKQSMVGRIVLKSDELTLHGIDLDRDLARFESSQNFNLVDVGAFLFAGPLGLAVTRGYSFARIFQASGGHSRIRKLLSEWKVEQGLAQAQDVAMATNENRIALRGRLDFVHQRFDDVIVALVDAKGCAVVQQTIRGTFEKPQVDKPHTLKTLIGPARELIQKGVELLPGGECEVFYAGSVAPPR
jgi:uncharacterized protein involved in outer membrane biogenesis